MAHENTAAGDSSHTHAVRFYRDEQDLASAVATFLLEGIIAAQPAVIIATRAHQNAILRQMTRRHLDVASARKIGDLVVLDAEQTLSTFMVGGMPDLSLFRGTIGHLFEQATRGRERTPVRAYGEMVDVLWRQGRTDAALRLEVLWNELATAYSFSLLCGYAKSNFDQQPSSRIDEIVQQHTHVEESPAAALGAL